ncbi:helix-turn-helix domain-containing protein [Streptomyces sp. NPDC091280]|uniref:helix-turn-helix domain-containing protein n=1 Tax=unclassified Streptomyces TaxID=2593676 RepID=UPI003806830D
MDEIVELGGRLRRLRRARGLTLAELGDKADLTSGYLANVENGVTTPSLSTLAALAAVMGTDMSAFFPATARTNVHVHRAAQMKNLRVGRNSASVYTVLSARAADPDFTGLVDHVSPSESTMPVSHFGERLALVLKGEIEMRIGTVVHRLGPGETLHYSSHPEHRLKVTSDEAAEILWVVTPAVL